ncbi:hypothetical protein J4Q44_G00332530 [Coregonus suidteri]|uniref:Uncharacterized protein n=1 Tax=Coregonus suidteri TaxID=861788 RepID=A0AAN8QFK6_9TELE
MQVQSKKPAVTSPYNSHSALHGVSPLVAVFSATEGTGGFVEMVLFTTALLSLSVAMVGVGGATPAATQSSVHSGRW